MVPSRAEEGAKMIPNRKSNQEGTKTNDTKTVLGLAQGPILNLEPPGGPFGRPKTTQNGAENDPKSKRKSISEKKPSKRIKDPSWTDLGRLEGAMWEPEDPKSIGTHSISCTCTFSKKRRFEEGSGNH